MAGGCTNDRQHGLQFKTQHLRVVPPTTFEGIEKYLGSGMVKGIGPHFARKLVRTFGEQVFEVIEQEPKRLLELEGIGPKRKDRGPAPGRSRRSFGRSWCSCSPMASAPPARCASTLLLVRNILQQADVPDGVTEYLEAGSALMAETLEALARGAID